MKKVCIVTITLGSNFGNRLQNLALQETIAALGHQVETVRNLTGDSKILRTFPVLLKIMEGIAANKQVCLFLNFFIKNPRIKKKICFLGFNKNYIKWSPYIVIKDQIPRAFKNNYDIYVCGSDQIWNPDMKFNSDIEFLPFVKREKKVAYAASFGTNDLPNGYLERISFYLSDFNYISVREKRALEFLKQIHRSDALLALDPTMLLTAKEWERREQRPDFETEEYSYILSYNLKTKTADSEKFIQDLSVKKNLKIIDLLDHKQADYYGIGPLEFIYLIHHAAIVCTDSFHATVFSLLYHKNFIVFDRKHMNSRIDTLLEIADMTDRKFSGLENIEMDFSRYDCFEKNLNKKRKQSTEFLIKALH